MKYGCHISDRSLHYYRRVMTVSRVFQSFFYMIFGQGQRRLSGEAGVAGLVGETAGPIIEEALDSLGILVGKDDREVGGAVMIMRIQALKRDIFNEFPERFGGDRNEDMTFGIDFCDEVGMHKAPPFVSDRARLMWRRVVGLRRPMMGPHAGD